MLNHQTHNDLPSNAKAVSIAILNARLADAIDLALLTKQAHWNIKGPNFIALHEMIDGFLFAWLMSATIGRVCCVGDRGLPVAFSRKKAKALSGFQVRRGEVALVIYRAGILHQATRPDAVARRGHLRARICLRIG